MPLFQTRDLAVYAATVGTLTVVSSDEPHPGRSSRALRPTGCNSYDLQRSTFCGVRGVAVRHPDKRKRMNPLLAPSQAALDAAQTIGRYDHVRVPDGRIGEVIGFYREADEKILVLLDTGGRRFLRADLRLQNERVDSFRAVAANDVHHNSHECKTGHFIELLNRTAGNGGLPLCTECAALRFAGPAVA
jgi:hypothetical protein